MNDAHIFYGEDGKRRNYFRKRVVEVTYLTYLRFGKKCR